MLLKIQTFSEKESFQRQILLLNVVLILTSGLTQPTGGINVLAVKHFSAKTKHSPKFTVLLIKTVFAYFWIKLERIEFAYLRKNLSEAYRNKDFCRCQSFSDCSNHSILFH